jgi:hypothetical protein
VGDGQAALKYLAPYIHRVAISNRRLLSFDNRGTLETSQVTFQFRASDTGQLKRCTLSVEQFFQRFLQHVLPQAFVKVRYYGFFGASVRRKLVALQVRLGKAGLVPMEPPPAPSPADHETPSKILCPICGLPMIFQKHLAPQLCRSP